MPLLVCSPRSGRWRGFAFLLAFFRLGFWSFGGAGVLSRSATASSNRNGAKLMFPAFRLFGMSFVILPLSLLFRADPSVGRRKGEIFPLRVEPRVATKGGDVSEEL